MATQYAFGKIVTNGLVLALDAADRNSYVSGSTTWFDLSGYNNSGSLVNGSIFDSSNGGSIVFDGVNDYVGPISNYNTYFNFQTANSFTICSFFKVITNSNYKALVVSSFNNVWNYGIWVSNTNKLLTGYDSNNREGNTVLNSQSIYYAALTYSSSTHILYLNGVIDGLFNSTGLGNSANQELMIAQRSGGVPNYFPGNIYNVQIYNRALSASEVQQNYNAQKSRFGL